jgi:hypothetical protein
MTENIRACLKDHNEGKFLQTTRLKPWRLKNYAVFSDERRARSFEKYLRSAGQPTQKKSAA